jgi:hypothetical protein
MNPTTPVIGYHAPNVVRMFLTARDALEHLERDGRSGQPIDFDADLARSWWAEMLVPY